MQIRGLFAGMAALAVLTLVGCGGKSGAADAGKTGSGTEKKTKTGSTAESKPSAALPAGVKAYTMDKCVISGKSIDPDCALVHEGQQVKFCCADCKPEFKKDPAKYLKLIAEGKTAKDQ